MARVLGIGIATLDIINMVDGFPAEDSEVRASEQIIRRGGNVTNMLVVLSQLGLQCDWAGTIADDSNSEIIRADLRQHAVGLDAIQCIPDTRTPTSYISLNRRNGSRTIVHYRDLPEYEFEQFRQIDLTRYDWLHFEGRNVAQTMAMMKYAKEQLPELPRSVEIEKPRDDIETLCEFADLLLYSSGYVINRHSHQRNQIHTNISVQDPANFLKAMAIQHPDADHVCAWGDRGAWGVSRKGKKIHRLAVKLSQTVDTLAAGDTFNAGIIAASIQGVALDKAIEKACQLAGKKCAQEGIEGLVN